MAKAAKQNAKSKKREKSKESLIGELEGLVDILSSDMITALDIKNEKKKLLTQIKELKEEEMELKEMVGHLKETKVKMETELRKKEQEEEDLKIKLSHFKDDTAKVESEKLSLEEQVKNLKREREELNNSLDRTNDILVKLKHHIDEFDEDIKS